MAGYGESMISNCQIKDSGKMRGGVEVGVEVGAVQPRFGMRHSSGLGPICQSLTSQCVIFFQYSLDSRNLIRLSAKPLHNATTSGTKLV